MSDHLLALITTHVWQITALAIVVAVVVKLAAKNRPHLAHALWVLVLIKCVTPPLWGHSLGVFSQLQARLMPDEPATLPDVSESPAACRCAGRLDGCGAVRGRGSGRDNVGPPCRGGLRGLPRRDQMISTQ